MMESIAQTAQTMSAAQFSMAYATSVTKMSMDMQEIAADGLQKMLASVPSAPVMPKGQFIDTYA